MSQPWRPRQKTENPWVSHTVAAHKAAGRVPAYANRYHENNDFYNSDNSDYLNNPDLRNISIRLDDIKTTIELIKKGEADLLHLDNLGLSDISDIPGVVDVLHLITSLSCSYNPITDLPNLRIKAPRLVRLSCRNTLITDLPPLPQTLHVLDCSTCGSDGFYRRGFRNPNGLRRLPRPLPPRLEYLYCSSNSLMYLPPLPATLKYLSAEHNNLKGLPQLPNSLRHLFINDNQLRNIPRLPPNIWFMQASGNPLEAPFNQSPLNILLTRALLSTNEINTIRPIIKDYWDHHTVNTMGSEMVSPESHLSAGTGKRIGYGFPVGPNANLLHYLNISRPRNKESFNMTRARLRSKVYPTILSTVNTGLFEQANRRPRLTMKNPNPLAKVNTDLFTGGTRRSKRSKYTRRR